MVIWIEIVDGCLIVFKFSDDEKKKVMIVDLIFVNLLLFGMIGKLVFLVGVKDESGWVFVNVECFLLEVWFDVVLFLVKFVVGFGIFEVK